jgi:hypothetical protein
MNDQQIEEFLRNNRPEVNDDPTFLLETQRRMRAVEGIKGEVDRQRHSGRLALILALAIGLAVGVFATAIAFLYPIDVTSVGDGVLDSVRVFLNTWKQYLLIPVAGCIVALTLLLTRSKDAAARL